MRSIRANQMVLRIKAIATPDPIPNRAMLNGIIRGNNKAPTKGVKATNQRNIGKLFKIAQNHSDSLFSLGFV